MEISCWAYKKYQSIGIEENSQNAPECPDTEHRLQIVSSRNETSSTDSSVLLYLGLLQHPAMVTESAEEFSSE
jgi:hypothetical protein